jgi:hypothetical protein
MADGTVACGLCGVAVSLTFQRTNDPNKLRVEDWSPLRDHLDTQCREMQPKALEAPKALHNELVGRIHRLLDDGHYLSRAASGACTMCGTNRDDCYTRLRRNVPRAKADRSDPARWACCPACGNGNTHPAPMETWDCQVWAAQYGSQS